jgi:hypothetical protein
MRRILVALFLVALIPGVASAGGGGGGSICPGFASGDTVSMLESCFAGTAHFAPSGAPITVRNDGQLPHTITAVDGSFDSGQLQAGASFELNLEPGVYKVFCTLHGSAEGNGMAGVLIVDDSTKSAAPVPPAAKNPGVAAEQTQSTVGLWLVVAAVAGGAALAILVRRIPIRPATSWTPPST